jgi:hypothetical protein
MWSRLTRELAHEKRDKVRDKGTNLSGGKPWPHLSHDTLSQCVVTPPSRS